MRINSVNIFQNEMVMVFNQNGEQIPELQGRFSKPLFLEIIRKSDQETKFFIQKQGVVYQIELEIDFNKTHPVRLETIKFKNGSEIIFGILPEPNAEPRGLSLDFFDPALW